MYSMTLVLDFGQNYLKLSYELYLITADNKQTILWKMSKVDSGDQRVKCTWQVCLRAHFSSIMLNHPINSRQSTTLAVRFDIFCYIFVVMSTAKAYQNNCSTQSKFQYLIFILIKLCEHNDWVVN